MMGWLFGKCKRRIKRRWDLEAPLLEWCRGAPFSIRDSFSGVILLGSTGSGKSSGSLALLARSYLGVGGYGGVFFTVKRDDCENYKRYAKEGGRERDLIIYSPVNPLRFNFIGAEIEQSPDPQSLADNLTALIMTVAKLGEIEGGKRGGGGENAEYFRQAAERLCRFALFVLLLSGQPVTMPNLYRLVISAPKARTEPRSTEWQKASFLYRCVKAAELATMSESQRADFELAVLYFFEEWVDLNERTRTTVESTLTAATDALSRGTARDCLSASPEACNFSPAMLEAGKIIVLDYPVLVHREVGRLIQVVVKHAMMRALSRRDVERSPRPVFLMSDECQHLMTEHDQLFATTARSSRTSLVYATQSVSTLLEAFGGSDAEPRMHSLLGNMQTQLHHQQTDHQTIQYLQQLIGRSRQFFMSGNPSSGDNWMAPLFGERSGSAGFSETMEFELQASDLNSLAKGGPPHFVTDAIVYRGGQVFDDGKSWRCVRIPQGKRR